MAENESLDLGAPYSQRWEATVAAVIGGAPCDAVAARIRRALYGGINKARNARRLQFLKAFLMQVAWLKDIDTFQQLPPAFARHLISTEVLSRGQSHEDVIELLARYRNEWMTIASDKREKGYNWARLLAMHEPIMEEGPTHASA